MRALSRDSGPGDIRLMVMVIVRVFVCVCVCVFVCVCICVCLCANVACYTRTKHPYYRCDCFCTNFAARSARCMVHVELAGRGLRQVDTD